MIKRSLAHLFQIFSTLSCARHLFKQTFFRPHSMRIARSCLGSRPANKNDPRTPCVKNNSNGQGSSCFPWNDSDEKRQERIPKEEGGAKDNRITFTYQQHRVPFTVEEYLLRMYTIQRLTTCSTRVRNLKPYCERFEQRGKASCDTLTRFESLQKKRVHHSLWSAIYRSLGSADARRSLGSVEVWDGVGWGGVVWGGMLTFIASGKHCREYGEGVGCGGCYRSLPPAGSFFARNNNLMSHCSPIWPSANNIDIDSKIMQFNKISWVSDSLRLQSLFALNNRRLSDGSPLRLAPFWFTSSTNPTLQQCLVL